MGKQKAAKVPVSRIRQMADSLMDLSNRKKQTAYEQKSMGQGAVRNGKGNVQVLVDNFGSTLSGNDRLKIADKFKKQASADSAKAVRFRALADKATAGRDKPLPSSDGIISTITNKISELFK
jgi:hypothetical protein